MKYEIVNLDEKKIVGLQGRTNNTSEDMGEVIGGLWNDFHMKGVYQSIENKVNDKAIGAYTDYAGSEMNDYTVVVACEVSNFENTPENTVKRTIPAGKYAKFIVKGHMQKAVMEFWEKLWKMDLARAFTYDFEEYQNSSIEDAEIHIYISLK